MPDIQTIRTLKTSPYLFLDNSRASSKALSLLKAIGVEPEIVKEAIDPQEKLPILMHETSTHKGLEGIEGWVRLLKLWSVRLPESRIFKISSNK